jgi:gliding motility-associated-like protein
VLYFSRKPIRKPENSLKRRFSCFLILLTQFAWAQQSTCYGSIENYNVDTTENSGFGTLGSTYHWKIEGNGFIGQILNDQTNKISVDWGETPPATYILSVEETNKGCKGLTKKIIVTILPIPQLNIKNLSICADPLTHRIESTAILDTQLSDSIYSFKWFLESNQLPFTTSEITVNTIGSYRVEITNKVTSCIVSDTTSVVLSSSAVANVKTTNDFDEIQHIIVTVTNGVGNYEYAIDGFTFQDDPIFTVSEPGNYRVTVRDKNGCSALSLETTIIKYPKFFTPNSDGYNDFWNVKGLVPSMNAVVNIFDRYGKLLKQFRGTDLGWDGTNSDGYSMPSTDYWFVIEYLKTNATPVVFKSHFSLKR